VIGPYVIALMLMPAAAPAPPAVQGPSSAPGAAPSLSSVCGTFIEVIKSEPGFKKTARCGPDDQLIITRSEPGLALRWSGTPKARLYPEAKVEDGKVVLRERRRTVYLERVNDQIIRVTFERRARSKSYLYGRLDYALELPAAAKDEKGCEF